VVRHNVTQGTTASSKPDSRKLYPYLTLRTELEKPTNRKLGGNKTPETAKKVSQICPEPAFRFVIEE